MSTTASGRPMRADARRNSEKLLAAARTAFSERGTDTSLEDIAQRAGVGIGTLYRHFPTRQDLVESLIRDEVDDLVALARDLLDAPDPDDALVSWVRAIVVHASTYRGLASSLMASLLDEGSQLANACHGMLSAGAELLLRAQQEGGVRRDITIEDLFTLANATAWSVEQSASGTASGDAPDPDAADRRIDRLLTLAVEGLASR
jgi:AcrR family transcriptional regulator